MRVILKGEGLGHPFRGNQWTKRGGSISTNEDPHKSPQFIPTVDFGEHELYPRAKDIPGLDPSADPKDEFIRLYGTEDTKSEYDFAITSEGKIVDYGKGGPNSIWLPREISYIYKDTTYIHNHPGIVSNALSLGAVSPDDIMTAIDLKMGAIMAVGRSYVGEMKPGKNGWPDLQAAKDFLKDGRGLAAYIDAKNVTKLTMTHEYDIERAAWKAHWEMFAKNFGCEYTEYDR